MLGVDDEFELGRLQARVLWEFLADRLAHLHV